MKIALLGTRGIPNYHGGFEQFCEYFSSGLVERGHSVTVYNSSEHPFQETKLKGVQIVHKFCPEKNLGPFAHFIYDFLCTKDAISRDEFDIIMHCGYQSAAPAIWLYKHKKAVIVCNMDGLEWKRDKWSFPIKLLTKLFERITVKNCRYLVSDNIGIKKYLENKYSAHSKFIPYGSNIEDLGKLDYLIEFDLTIYKYYIIVARLEPENSIETILLGYTESNANLPLIVVGNHNSHHANYLIKKFQNNSKIKFIGGVYDKNKLDSLRKYSKIYFHGHTVGGTNPSLLEAMSLGCFIVYHNNPFNSSVLEKNGKPFLSTSEICSILKTSETSGFDDEQESRKKCMEIIAEKYSWNKIIEDYENYFKNITLQ